MLDYAVLPPEVNSARMYAGAGSGSLVAAAAAWDRLAGSLASAEQSCRVVLEELTDGSWQGSSAAAMTGAARPYLAWLSGTAVQAAQTAEQARGAVAAYEAAFSATVPPAVIGANRSALAVLVRTNVFGQNTAAIAANQAEYAQMWAQDAAAMHAYATSAAAVAPQPGAFTAPPQTTNPSAAAGPGPLTQLAEHIVSNPTIAKLGTFLADATNWNQSYQVAGLAEAFIQYTLMLPQIVGAETAAVSYAGSLGLVGSATTASIAQEAEQFTLAGASAAGAPVSGDLGRATPIGRLSVPPSWAGTASQGIRLAAGASSLAAAPAAGAGTASPWLGGIPPVGPVSNASKTTGPALRGGSTLKVLPSMGREDTDDSATRYWTAPQSSEPKTADLLSEHEQRELDRLRESLSELRARRDAAARSIREAIH